MEYGVWGRVSVASGKESRSSEVSWNFLLKELEIKMRETSEHIQYSWS